jgi:phosphoglycolate phosphatase
MTVFFVDLDGTIIDPKAGMVGSFRQALQNIGCGDLAMRNLDWIIGPPVIGSFEKVLRNRRQAEEAMRLYRLYYTVSGQLFDFSVYPGVLAALAALSAEGQVFICTMKPEALAKPILEKLGLSFGLFGADLDGEIRRKEQLLQRAVDQLAVDPADCLVIGDRGADMAAARGTAMRALGVTWGYGSAIELVDAGAHTLCDDPVALVRTALHRD